MFFELILLYLYWWAAFLIKSFTLINELTKYSYSTWRMVYYFIKKNKENTVKTYLAYEAKYF